MGKTTSKKMIPLLILRILWKHADKENMVTMDFICNRLEEDFEAERRMTRLGLQKLVSSNIRQLNLFFQETQWKPDGQKELQICERTVANPNQSGGYIKTYYLNGRLFTDTEIRMLHDSILFSPGIDNNCAKRLLEKLKRCASKYFGSWFEFVKYREMLKRTKNAYVYNYLVEIGKAIKRSRKVSFRYRKNGRLTDKVFKVSPYFLIISGGWYYLICNTDGKEALSHYRIDRMEQVEMNFERGRDFYSVESVDDFFEISKYLEEHPRMSYEEPVSATLLVDETLVEAVELEFRITAKMKAQDNVFRMRIISTKTAICNWIINLTEYIRIETTSDPSIIELLCYRARCIIELYQKAQKQQD